MIRTQIYLTNEEKQELDALAERTGKRQSALIREALDVFLRKADGHRRQEAIRRAAGLWRNRTDLPETKF